MEDKVLKDKDDISANMQAPKGYIGGYSEGWWKIARKNRELIRQYNTIEPDRLWDKYLILKELLGQVDEKAIIEPPFYCDDGKNIFAGRQLYANFNLTILDSAPVRFGDHVVIGPNVTISTVTHPIHPESRYHNGVYPVIASPVTIESNVWIGANVTILPGVTIGKGSVIGAGSVVTKDIPAMSVAAGVPCRVLRAISDADRYTWPEGTEE